MNNVNMLTKLANMASSPAGKAAIAALIAGGGGLARRGRRRRRRRPQATKTDRTIVAPVSRGRVLQGTTVPTIRVRHREFVQDITTTQGQDEVTKVFINPGSPISFPWVSGIASCFEKYKVHSITYEYVTATSTATTGSIALAPDYDPDDENLDLNKAQILMFTDVVRGPFWASLKCPLKHVDRTKWYFTRKQGGHPHPQLKLSDPGQLMLVISEPSVTATVGELWVNYDFTFSVPEFEDSIQHTFHCTIDLTTQAVADWFPNYREHHATYTDYYSHLGMEVMGSGSDALNRGWVIWESGKYRINVIIEGTGINNGPTIALRDSTSDDDLTFDQSIMNAATTRWYGIWYLVVGHWSGWLGSRLRTSNTPLIVYTSNNVSAATTTKLIFSITKYDDVPY